MAKFDRSPLKYSPFRSKRLIPSKTLSASHRKPRASSADSAVALRPVVLATPRDEDPQDLPRYFADLDACRANRGADGAWVSPEQLGQEALRLAEPWTEQTSRIDIRAHLRWQKRFLLSLADGTNVYEDEKPQRTPRAEPLCRRRKQRLVPVGPPPQAAPESEYVLEPVWMAQTVWGGGFMAGGEAIEWGDLYRATNRDNTPTPGYLFNDIVQNVSNASPSAIPEVAQYLIDCVNGDHAHVKLKSLFVIKTLAYRIPPFQQAFLSQPDGWSSVLEASVFTGPPSPMFGDEPYRLVREAAEGAKEALETTEFYHQEYKELSQRIVGFGNYQPPEDTKLPDGSVNVAKDVTFGDVLGTAVGGVLNGAGAIFQGVKGLFETHSRHVSGLELDGIGMDEPEEEVEDPYEEEAQMRIEEEDEYHAPAGDYIPPLVPTGPTDADAVECAEEPACPSEPQVQPSVSTGARPLRSHRPTGRPKETQNPRPARLAPRAVEELTAFESSEAFVEL
ncbi:AP-4 complex accessory subunit Tepsin (ENTH domain-containing protein 2) (Epsin for AP-4) (Tetra-epsin) [Durusdinium trenchii]|uniref:AP-4 complex accessory subunit Tepsin (ENTH domain-containing protein 2) (Epsin for AP-4) (Tetra-epsin) n=1 Tax=Durusdinium trenchii TaxID=1381693 RepID=A0ABP0QM45_9DINO